MTSATADRPTSHATRRPSVHPVANVPIAPADDRVLIRPDDPEKMIGSIVIPDNAQEKSTRGTIVRVGPGKLMSDGPLAGQWQKLRYGEGQRVLYERYAGHPIEHDGIEYKLMSVESVLATLEE